MNYESKLDRVYKAALVMAPAFRDKFDFADGTMPGEKNQYQRLADMAFAAGEALVEQYDERYSKETAMIAANTDRELARLAKPEAKK